METVLVYGSYGYTGRLIVEEAIERGLEPVIAGRNVSKVETQANELGLEHRVFETTHAAIVARQLESIDCVLNCAGPFEATYEPIVDACLETETDYLDITGEISVFEAIAEKDEAAAAAGVTLLPGVGFDVVPSDCLGAHLAGALDDPTSLQLGFDSLGSPTIGTALSTLDGLAGGGMIREGGSLKSVGPAYSRQTIDFGEGDRAAVTIPWGDVSTAYRTTGIESVEFYMALPPAVIRALSLAGRLTPLLDSPPVKQTLESVLRRTVSGPSEDELESGVTRLWGRVTDGTTERVARLKTPNGYALTAKTAVECAKRTLAGDVPVGYQTPANAFGPEFVLSFDGVVRRDAMKPTQSS